MNRRLPSAALVVGHGDIVNPHVLPARWLEILCACSLPLAYLSKKPCSQFSLSCGSRSGALLRKQMLASTAAPKVPYLPKKQPKKCCKGRVWPANLQKPWRWAVRQGHTLGIFRSTSTSEQPSHRGTLSPQIPGIPHVSGIRNTCQAR